MSDDYGRLMKHMFNPPATGGPPWTHTITPSEPEPSRYERWVVRPITAAYYAISRVVWATVFRPWRNTPWR